MTTKGLITRTLYVLSADSARARIYATETPFTALTLVRELGNSDARKKTSERYSDHAGGKQGGPGGYHHSFTKDRENPVKEAFARELCEFLHQAHLAGKFDSLVLIAPPHFLGELRNHLHKDCRDITERSINKDLVDIAEPDLLELIREKPA